MHQLARVVACASLMVACTKTEPPPKVKQCVYQDVTYSIGATRCGVGKMSPPGYQVFECHDGGNGPEWIGTASLCNPSAVPPTAGSGSGSGAGSGSGG
jgi:hypothetical protein